MHSARSYAFCMTSLQIRNVPDELHRQLKARAALEGQSLSEYALGELRRAMQRPTRRELAERVASFERPPSRNPLPTPCAPNVMRGDRPRLLSRDRMAAGSAARRCRW